MQSIATQCISEFKGQYRFLSNFYPVFMKYEGVVYRTLEHAYQAAKTTDIDKRIIISNLQYPSGAKKYGKYIDLRPNWDEIKLDIMLELLQLKFKPNTSLGTMLINTYPLLLVEGNNWHDNFWGECRCVKCNDCIKSNNLGVLLMKVRNILRSSTDENCRS